MTLTSPLENLAGVGGSLRVEAPDEAEWSGLVRSAGYRATNRYIGFQVLPHTLGPRPEVWRVLDRCHKLRNQSEYEGELLVDDRIVIDLIAACDAVVAALDRRA